ncbi:hypothetical protein AC1031_002213 [Aphanomyces cochlioides]|nr:hypothetical protein AC1031_002213 [Aphanomyces cochlioides]
MRTSDSGSQFTIGSSMLRSLPTLWHCCVGPVAIYPEHACRRWAIISPSEAADMEETLNAGRFINLIMAALKLPTSKDPSPMVAEAQGAGTNVACRVWNHGAMYYQALESYASTVQTINPTQALVHRNDGHFRTH